MLTTHAYQPIGRREAGHDEQSARSSSATREGGEGEYMLPDHAASHRSAVKEGLVPARWAHRSHSAWMAGRDMLRRSWQSPYKPRINSSHAGMLAVTLFFVVAMALSMLPASYMNPDEAEPEYDMIPSDMTGDNTFLTLAEDVQSKLSMPALQSSDRRDRTMSDARCRREFPLLYPQLDELLRYWQMRGGISREMIEANERGASRHWGHVRVVIHKGKVLLRSFVEGGETRNSAIVHLLQQAVESWPGGAAGDDHLPTIDLILSAGDRDMFPKEGGWTVTKRVDDHYATGRWLIPDFGFVGWPEANIPSFEEFLDLAAKQEQDYPWYRKHTRAFWRGFANVYAVRKDLIQRTDTVHHPERERWADVHQTTFHPDGIKEYYPLVTLPEHCQHKYLIHVEGNSYSGRSRYLLSCHAVTIAHPLQWTQHFHPALNNVSSSPDQNFVQLPGPHFYGLEEALHELRVSDGLIVNETESTTAFRGWPWNRYKQKPAPIKVLGVNGAQKIADNVVRTLRDRYLTPAATMCYTRAALRHYAESVNATSWGPRGPTILPGHGVAPDSSKGRPMGHLKGDIEVGVWRLLGGPNWPPMRW